MTLDLLAVQANGLLTAAVTSALTILATAASRAVIASKQARHARALADEQKFKDALASADLTTLGTMLRDQFGTVPLSAILDDTVTQSKVFRSLERLAEVVNKPVDVETETPGKVSAVPEAAAANGSVDTSRSRLLKIIPFDLRADDERERIASHIVDIADQADIALHAKEVWTALAGARRSLEVVLFPETDTRRRVPLSYRLFESRRARGAMSAFVTVANRAIHGEQTDLADAEGAIRALRVIAREVAPSNGSGRVS